MSNPERIIYTPIAKSIPEFSKKDGTVYTCSLGYSPQKGLIRVYPLPISGIDKWGVYEIPIERNKRDSRKESFKLASYSRKEDFIGLDKDVHLKSYVKNKFEFQQQALSKYIYPSISKMNELRISVGLVKADSFKLFWETNKRFINTKQYGMFEDVEISTHTIYTKETKLKESRIMFSDEDGKHNLQFNEWQFYEFQRKAGATKEAFRHHKPSDESYILLGNMNARRNIWIGLGIFEIFNVNQLIMF